MLSRRRNNGGGGEEWLRLQPPLRLHFVPSVRSVICFGVLISAKSIIFFVVLKLCVGNKKGGKKRGGGGGAMGGSFCWKYLSVTFHSLSLALSGLQIK